MVIKKFTRFGLVGFAVIANAKVIHTCMSVEGARSFVLKNGGSI